MQDVALVSLANVLYRSGFDMDALAVIHMSLEVSLTTLQMVETALIVELR